MSMSFLLIEIGLAHVKVLQVSQIVKRKTLKTLRTCYYRYTYVLKSKKSPPSTVKSPPKQRHHQRSHLKQRQQVGLQTSSQPSSRPKGGTVLYIQRLSTPPKIMQSTSKISKVMERVKGEKMTRKGTSSAVYNVKSWPKLRGLFSRVENSHT